MSQGMGRFDWFEIDLLSLRDRIATERKLQPAFVKKLESSALQDELKEAITNCDQNIFEWEQQIKQMVGGRNG